MTTPGIPSTVHDFDEYGPNRDGECHFGTCRQPATHNLAEVPYCWTHYQTRIALRARLSQRETR